MQRSDRTTMVGIVAGVAVIVTALMLGGNILLFWNIPSVLITIGGSLAGVTISFDIAQLRGAFQVARQVLLTKNWDIDNLIAIFYELARKARREGLLALEDDIGRLDDPFYQKGIRMMVDAIEPEVIRSVLEAEMDYTTQRHELGQRLLRTWAELAPAFGMIGTLIGLIQMLAQLEDPSKLGPGMAVALITTFYGAILANLILIPMANKLALRHEEEMAAKELMIEAITSIQSGINPRILEDKLRAFQSPAARLASATAQQERRE
ncbi:MAG: motility protein A [Clostridia bacterium]|nr:MAG: motility protein A [Clostridia bacterium]